MTDPNSSSSSLEIDVPKIVRFDTLDIQFVSPLREFFSSFGCQVYYSTGNGFGLLYHVVVGDREFVKDFLDLHLSASRKLLIIWDVYQDDVDLPINPEWKTVFVDPHPLTPAAVQEILKFFFTATTAVLDLRHQPVSNRPLRDTEKSTVPRIQADELRVKETITAMFAHDEQTHISKFQNRLQALAFIVKTWLFCILLIVAPILWYSGLMGISVAALILRAENLRSTRPPGSYLRQMSTKSLEQAEQSLNLIALPFVWLDYSYPVRAQERLLQTLKTSASALTTAESFTLVAREFASVLFRAPSTNAFPLTTAQRLQIILSQLTTQLDLITADLHVLLDLRSPPFNFSPVYRLADQFRQRLMANRHQLTNLDRLLVLYPAIAGFKNEQLFLVLLQNSLELRPGGGFIGSLGIAKFQEGLLADFQIQDVYQVDGQLKGHVDPPGPVAELLMQEHWYLRDSNWDPDFRINARQAAWFYEKETGTRVDGVIALSVPFIVELLKATGPLTIPDYAERITAENFFGKSLFYTQADFFPGSTQKRDFLGAVSTALLEKFTAQDGTSPISIFKAYEQALASRDIQWYLSDPAWQSVIELFGWAGEYPPVTACPPLVTPTSCLLLFAGWVEANVSVNKANYFLKRSLKRELTLDEIGRITEKHILTYENTSPPDGANGGGPYRAYLRLYSQTPVMPVAFYINGQKVSPKSAAASVPYIEPITAPSALTGTAVVFDVIPGALLTLEAQLIHKEKLPFSQGKSYLYVYEAKQSGVTNAADHLVINYPGGWSMNQLSGSSLPDLANTGLLQYNMPTSQDYSALLEFRPLE